MPGGLCDRSQSVGGVDSELTITTMTLRTPSSGAATPD